MNVPLLKSKKVRFYVFILVVVFLVLFVVGYASFYYRLVLDLLYPVQKAVEKSTKTVEDFFSLIARVENIIEKNEQLEKELQRLKLLDARLRNIEFENFKLRQMLNFSKKYGKYEITGANVIGYPADNFVKAIIIDVGKDGSVEEGDYVVSDGVLVGRITEVGDFSSRVLLANDSSFKIPARTRKTREFVFYSGKGYLDFVKPYQDIRVDDIIETAGIDGYPRGIPIGKITLVEYNEGEFFKKVKVKPFVKQFSIEYVLVISKKKTLKKKR